MFVWTRSFSPLYDGKGARRNFLLALPRLFSFGLDMLNTIWTAFVCHLTMSVRSCLLIVVRFIFVSLLGSDLTQIFCIVCRFIVACSFRIFGFDLMCSDLYVALYAIVIACFLSFLWLWLWYNHVLKFGVERTRLDL